MENPQIIESQEARDNSEFSLQKIVAVGLQYWWLFILILLAALGCAFLYLRYSTPQYKIQAKILVKDSKKGGGASGMQVFEELGLLGGQNSVDNEVELLKSRTLMENTVNALQLNARYFTQGKVKQVEIFKEQLPFILELVEIQEDSLLSNIHLSYQEVSALSFRLILDEREKVHQFGDTVSYPFGKLVFQNSGNIRAFKQSPITITIGRTDLTALQLQQKMEVAVTSKTVSTIDLTLTDAVPSRGELLLKTLLRIYNQMNTEDKNRVADSTIGFIDNRLVFVTRELSDVERGIEQFRQQNQLTDISAQGKLLLENSSEYFKELSKSEVQISILQSLEKYLKDDQNETRTIPAGLVIDDPTFASLIEKYNSLQLEKDRQLQTTTESNPVVQRLDVQLANLRADIISNLATIKRSMEITKGQLRSRTNSFENQISQVPRKERAFLEISRQQAIKQELYLYLLKKREETAVSKAANIDNARIIDSAKAQRVPFSPKKSQVYLLALLAAIALPAIALYLKNILNNKVENKTDITSSTQTPILGEIGRSPYSDNLLIKVNPRHPVTEQFRLLRTNLDFMQPLSSTGRVVMVTSSMSGEGKSFLSLNLAAMLSLGGKKVVLLEFDLRKPKLSKYLNLPGHEGLSNYLVKNVTDLSAITKKVEGVENMYFLSSGVIPPNPAELIKSEQASILFKQLKESFDHIIVDAPPVGVVTDALLLSSFSDVTLYVVRQNYTFKNQIDALDELYKQKRLPNVGIVVNDIKHRKGYGYTAGYGYGYGYGDIGDNNNGTLSWKGLKKFSKSVFSKS